jgi:hypothetical protein
MNAVLTRALCDEMISGGSFTATRSSALQSKKSKCSEISYRKLSINFADVSIRLNRNLIS